MEAAGNHHCRDIHRGEVRVKQESESECEEEDNHRTTVTVAHPPVNDTTCRGNFIPMNVISFSDEQPSSSETHSTASSCGGTVVNDERLAATSSTPSAPQASLVPQMSKSTSSRHPVVASAVYSNVDAYDNDDAQAVADTTSSSANANYLADETASSSIIGNNSPISSHSLYATTTTASAATATAAIATARRFTTTTTSHNNSTPPLERAGHSRHFLAERSEEELRSLLAKHRGHGRRSIVSNEPVVGEDDDAALLAERRRHSFVSDRPGEEDDAAAAAARSALQTLLEMNVDALTSEELRNRVRRVQQSCSSCDGRGGSSTANGDASAIDNAAKKKKKTKEAGVADGRHEANPIIGWRAYIFSGPFAGLSGRLVSDENRGWYLVDNPALGGKRVHSSIFRLVDNGMMDVSALREFWARRNRILPSIVDSDRVDGLRCELLARRGEAAKRSGTSDKKEGRVDNSTMNGSESSRCNQSVEETSKKRRKAENREMASLKDFLRPGLHWLPPVSPGRSAITTIAKNSVGPMNNYRQTLRSRHATNNEPVVKDRCFDDDNHARNEGGRSELQPTHYSSVPEHLSVVANRVKDELLRRFLPGWNGANNFVVGAYEVQSGAGYFRGHIRNEVAVQLRDCLPGHFCVKERSSQIGIVFYNSRDGACECHFDRDSSALVLVSGYKEVRIAPPLGVLDRPADGILDDVDPFSADAGLHGGLSWETVHMGPGSVLIIPKYWLHCVRSTPNTLALSFQITLAEGKSPPERVWVPNDVTTTTNNRVEQSAGEARVAGNDVESDSVSHPKPQGKGKWPKLEAVPTTTGHGEKPARPGKVATASSVSRSNSEGLCRQPKAEPPSPAQRKVKSEPNNPRGKIKSEAANMSFSKRSSSRHVPTCAICQHGFDGREMWVLRHQGSSPTPEYLPEWPIGIAKHLICKDCCPGNGTGIVLPWDIIRYPDGTRRRVLSKAEFCEEERLGEIDYKRYAYVSASYIDYTSQVIGKRGHTA
eukprot:CAMPEP_0181102772 /NCGR_PEP_ID=MMETSP1071-20121207/14496_1 /TAXON_ID=35127 /ORGANISM="Thalassiosira sp., Strain NH16" /LENGTH=997 /DNA_ID=CAMNT_0023185773 /DNA_START=219 /DNA_END=3212 /DNA_ORIENTATION=-